MWSQRVVLYISLISIILFYIHKLFPRLSILLRSLTMKLMFRYLNKRKLFKIYDCHAICRHSDKICIDPINVLITGSTDINICKSLIVSSLYVLTVLSPLFSIQWKIVLIFLCLLLQFINAQIMSSHELQLRYCQVFFYNYYEDGVGSEK